MTLENIRKRFQDIAAAEGDDAAIASQLDRIAGLFDEAFELEVRARVLEERREKIAAREAEADQLDEDLANRLAVLVRREAALEAKGDKPRIEVELRVEAHVPLPGIGALLRKLGLGPVSSLRRQLIGANNRGEGREAVARLIPADHQAEVLAALLGETAAA